MKPILNFIGSALAIAISAYLLPGVSVSGLVPLLILVIVLAAVNMFIKPLLTLLTLPLNVITLGLFSFVINALLIMLASWIVPGFAVSGFLSALIFAVVLAVVNAVLDRFGL